MPHGVIHVGGAETISRLDFAKLLRNALGMHEAKLVGCRQSCIKMPASRPQNVTLSIVRARQLGFHPGDILGQLKALLKRAD